MSPLSTTWAQVLDRVEAALSRAAAQIAEQERALAASPHGDAVPMAGEPATRSELQDRLERWHRGLEQADQAVAAESGLIAGDEGALRQWLASAEAFWRELADQSGRPV
jgi:hypothetical protein